MVRIEQYILYFTPNGMGRIHFKLQGEINFRVSKSLTAPDFSAVAILLTRQNLGFDPIHQVFVSTDDANIFTPLLNTSLTI